MTNYSTGHEAEKWAAEYLKQKGYKIIEVNWKTRYCEIDIIATKNNTIYLTEVKHRKNSAYGTGLDYINTKKLKQMHFAAEMWVSDNKWQGNYQLAAIELSGPNYDVTNFLTEL